MPSRRSLHPGLASVLDKLHAGADVTDGDVERLARQIAYLESQQRHQATAASLRPPQPIEPPDRALLPGRASVSGTATLADRLQAVLPHLYRDAQGLRVSSVGLGTYRGVEDEATDASYRSTLRRALRGGINLIDTSLNYRNQRSERVVGHVLGELVGAGRCRDEILICTKGGFLVPGAVDRSTLDPVDVVNGTHAIAPAFLADQIDRSLRNLGVATVDVYYLHNPEVQLASVGATEFHRRMRDAFACLEECVAAGKLAWYGTSTWDGFLDGSLSLTTLTDLAREVAGDGHHFRFVQLPFNLGRQEAAAHTSGGSVLGTAQALGLTVIASAPLLQGRLSDDLPACLRVLFHGLSTDAQRALQFARSAPGVVSCLVGTSSPRHIEENLAVGVHPPLTPTEFTQIRAVTG